MTRKTTTTSILLSIIMVTGFAGLAQAAPVTVTEDGDGTTATATMIVMTVTWTAELPGEEGVEYDTTQAAPQLPDTDFSDSVYATTTGNSEETCGGIVAIRCVEVNAETRNAECESVDGQDALDCSAKFLGSATGTQWISQATIEVEGFLDGASQGTGDCLIDPLNDEETLSGCTTSPVDVSVGVTLPEEDGAKACTDTIRYQGFGEDAHGSVGPAWLEGEACWEYHEEAFFVENPFGDDEDPDDGDDGSSGGCQACDF